jgi:hypothetical protein
MIAAGTPNWKPLQTFIAGRGGLGEWMWMYHQGDFEYYKHRDTRRYLILDHTGMPHGHIGDSLMPIDARLAFDAVTGARP